MGDPPPDLARPPESDEELVEFLAHATVGVCWVDPAGRLLWANRTCLELLGCPEHERPGHSIAGYFVEPQAADEVLGRLRRRETVKGYEAGLRTKAGAVPSPQARLVGLHRLPATEPAEHFGGGLGFDEVLGDGVADGLAPGAPERLQAGLVRPEHAPLGIHPAHADRGVSEELDELLVVLGRPRTVGRAALHQLRRVARLATTVISSAGCTGLERCSWKPARSARRRSSVRA